MFMTGDELLKVDENNRRMLRRNPWQDAIDTPEIKAKRIEIIAWAASVKRYYEEHPILQEIESRLSKVVRQACKKDGDHASVHVLRHVATAACPLWVMAHISKDWRDGWETWHAHMYKDAIIATATGHGFSADRLRQEYYDEDYAETYGGHPRGYLNIALLDKRYQIAIELKLS